MLFIIKSLKDNLKHKKERSTILICKNINYISHIIRTMQTSKTYFNWFYFFFS